jgi:hypothetical protein
VFTSCQKIIFFLCAKHVIFCLLVYDLQQDLWYFTTKLSDTTWVIEDTSSINHLYTSSWRTSEALAKVSLSLSVKTYNCSRLRVLHKKRQQKKCTIVNQVVQLYVQMILLPDLIRLIVFSVIRKVIKKDHKFHKIESQDRMKKILDAG